MSTDTTADTSPVSLWSPLLIIMSLAVAVRIFAWLLTSPTPLLNDEFAYFGRADSWVAGKVALNDGRPPMTSLLNAFSMVMIGKGVFLTRGMVVFFGCAIVALIYAIASAIGGRRAGIFAGAIAAFYPTLVAFSHYLLSETYFLFFFLAAVLLGLRLSRQQGAYRPLLIGLLCGLAALTREVGLMLAGAMSLAAFWNHRPDHKRGAKSATLVVVAAAIVILPWSVNIYRTTGMISLVSQTTWLNLYVANPPSGSRHPIRSYGEYRSLGATTAERSAAARNHVLSAIRSRMPYWPLQKLRNLRSLFRPTSIPVKRLLMLPGERGNGIGEWGYRFSAPSFDTLGFRRSLAAATATSYWVIAITGLAGLVISTRRGTGLLLLVGVTTTIPTVIGFALTRFRMPWECFFIIGTGLLLSDGCAAWRRATPLRRVTCVAGVVLLFALIASNWSAFLSRNMY